MNVKTIHLTGAELAEAIRLAQKKSAEWKKQRSEILAAATKVDTNATLPPRCATQTDAA